MFLPVKFDSNATHDGKDKAIFGKDFVVKFTPAEGYRMTVSQMVVKINGFTTYEWDFDTATNTLTIKAAAVDGYITIEAHAEKIPNTYTVTLPTGTGFTSAAAATYESLKVVEGKEFRFVVSIVDGYRATADFKVKANGVELTKDGTGYVINNITADQVITVGIARSNMSKSGAPAEMITCRNFMAMIPNESLNNRKQLNILKRH